MAEKLSHSIVLSVSRVTRYTYLKRLIVLCLIFHCTTIYNICNSHIIHEVYRHCSVKKISSKKMRLHFMLSFRNDCKMELCCNNNPYSFCYICGVFFLPQKQNKKCLLQCEMAMRFIFRLNPKMEKNIEYPTVAARLDFIEVSISRFRHRDITDRVDKPA